MLKQRDMKDQRKYHICDYGNEKALQAEVNPETEVMTRCFRASRWGSFLTE